MHKIYETKNCREIVKLLIDKEKIDIEYDIHVRRIFLRLGLVDRDLQEDILNQLK